MRSWLHRPDTSTHTENTIQLFDGLDLLVAHFGLLVPFTVMLKPTDSQYLFNGLSSLRRMKILKQRLTLPVDFLMLGATVQTDVFPS